jgi:hypothetical protein
MADNTISSELRLPLYISSRYLKELDLALQLIGMPTRYERPGSGGIVLPRLYVEHPARRCPDKAICALPWLLESAKPEWWFEWFGSREDIRDRICAATDLPYAARIITERLGGKA